MPMRGAAVVSAASAFPADSISTVDIERRLGLDNNWILKRTGVRSRRRARADEQLSDLGATAAARALEMAGAGAEEIDLVVVATMTPDEGLPSTAARIANRLGAPHAGALDVGAACSGFVGALALATGCVESGRARQVLVVGGDLMSRVIDADDKVTGGIFGDGVGAVVVRAIEGPTRVGPYVLGSDASQADAILADHPHGPVRMDGPRVFGLAISRLVEISTQAAARAGLTLDDIDLLVPHQANARITKAVRERLGIARERVVDCIADYGNTTGGSLPTALSYAHAEGRLVPGSRVLLAAFGAGLVWGAVAMTWGTPVES